MYWYTDTDNLVQILPAHAAPDTQNHILNICVLSRVTTLPMWSNLWDVWCPSVSFSTDWQSDYLYVCVCVCVGACVCVHHCFVSVWFQGWGRLQEWPLRCLTGRHDPSRSASITTWNLNVKHAPLPLLQPFVFLCGSVCLDTRLCMQTHSPVIIWAQIYAAGSKCNLLLDSGCDLKFNQVISSNQFELCCDIDWFLSVRLDASCLYLAYLWVDWLTFGANGGRCQIEKWHCM